MKKSKLSDMSPIENLSQEQRDIFKQAVLNIEKRKGKEYPPTAKEIQDEMNTVIFKMETTTKAQTKEKLSGFFEVIADTCKEYNEQVLKPQNCFHCGYKFENEEDLIEAQDCGCPLCRHKVHYEE